MKIHKDLDQMRRDFEEENSKIAARRDHNVAVTTGDVQYQLKSKS